MLTIAQKNQIVRIIGSYDDLYGSPVVYVASGGPATLYEGIENSDYYGRIVVISEDKNFNRINLPQSGFLASHNIRQVQEQPGTFSNIYNQVTAFLGVHTTTKEIIGAGLSCSAMVVAGGGVAAGIAGEPITFGGSSILVGISWAGLSMSALQCTNGIMRVGLTLTHDGSASLIWLDKNATYNLATFLVDAVGVSASMAGPTSAIVKLLQDKASLPLADILMKANRAQRQKFFMDAIEKAGNDSTLKKQISVQLERAFPGKDINKMLSMGGSAASRSGAPIAIKAIEKAVMQRIVTEIRTTVFSNTGLGWAVSASPPELTASGSGSLYSAWHGDVPTIFINFIDQFQESN